MRKGVCMKCRSEIRDDEMYATPIGWLCVVCLRIVVKWVHANDSTLKAEFRKFWPNE